MFLSKKNLCSWRQNWQNASIANKQHTHLESNRHIWKRTQQSGVVLSSTDTHTRELSLLGQQSLTFIRIWIVDLTVIVAPRRTPPPLLFTTQNSLHLHPPSPISLIRTQVYNKTGWYKRSGEGGASGTSKAQVTPVQVHNAIVGVSGRIGPHDKTRWVFYFINTYHTNGWGRHKLSPPWRCRLKPAPIQSHIYS
jgi:hypothetical protein